MTTGIQPQEEACERCGEVNLHVCTPVVFDMLAERLEKKECSCNKRAFVGDVFGNLIPEKCIRCQMIELFKEEQSERNATDATG